MAETISIREFSRRVNVSDTAIRKAINAGYIVAGRVFENGGPRILFEEAKREWDIYQTQQGKAVTAKPKTGTPTQSAKPAVNPTPPAPVVPAPLGEAPKPQAGTIAAARLVKEQLNAKLLEIELKEKMGKLVDKDRVYAALFSAGKELRVNLQTIPDRHIDDILAAPSRNEAHTILYNAIAEVLEQITELGKTDFTRK
jgi:hypothetical protein